MIICQFWKIPILESLDKPGSLILIFVRLEAASQGVENGADCRLFSSSTILPPRYPARAGLFSKDPPVIMATEFRPGSRKKLRTMYGDGSRFSRAS